ncbi:MAG: N,N-dimethylformamidase beta subunit family domain-containing protein [Actinomycetes bacterium]
MKRLNFGRRSILLNAIILLLIIVTGVTYQKYGENVEPKLAPIAVHKDLPATKLLQYDKSLLAHPPTDLSVYKDSSCAPLAKNWVATENARPGVTMTTSEWSRIDVAAPSGSVLWLDKTSVSCGETVKIHASLYEARNYNFDKGPRQILALRIGWYGGTGARSVWNSGPVKLKSQRIPFATTAVRMIETKWPVTKEFTVGPDWTPGFYLLTTISPHGKIEGIAPLIVRAPLGSSKLLLVHSTLTWNAYNFFGGRSMYFGAGSTPKKAMAERSRVASLDRPIVGSGAVHIQRDAISFIQFLEKEGLSVDQSADTDLDQWPSIAQHYSALVFSGHAEYFTRREFDTVLAARNQGINLAFFGANTAYWQMRLEPSPSGPNRHLVMYRVATEDPVTTPTGVTVQFNDPRVHTPSVLFTGGYTDGVHVSGNLLPVKIPAWLHIPATTELRGWASDSEIEGAYKSHATPPNIHVIFTGTMKLRANNASGRIPIAHTIWFTTPSGSAIFNAGITLWPCELLPSCQISTMDSTSRASLQSITKQVLTLWQTKAVGKVLK